MEREGLFNGNSSVDLDRVALYCMWQSVVAETALTALSSRLLLLFKISPMLDVNVLADLTATDNR
ncbi:unnamed protein product [Dovyalis caffra]|uniref:Uncharacterized protein n=1 Tax=Dovyalis caffra TaxID=77055 RepID=A0AAV1SSE5_9ROSI|nr:unnamed protein product [Dovyalis caffra]